jgi:hypothetical protein
VNVLLNCVEDLEDSAAVGSDIDRDRIALAGTAIERRVEAAQRVEEVLRRFETLGFHRECPHCYVRAEIGS